jgi:hypothetical protein
MPLDELTITLSDKEGRVSVETLTNALENALNMLRSMEFEMVSAGIEVRWEVVRVRMRSPLRLTFAPRIAGRRGKSLGRKIVKACLRGVEEIEKQATLPPHFNDDALSAARKLAKTSDDERTSLTISSNGSQKVTLTKKAVQHIDEIASKARLYIDFSTIEGRLEIVSVHDHLSFFIWETLTNHRIECFSTESQLIQATSLLQKRVAVTGRVHYRNHVPKSIDVESIRGLRDANELPQPKDIGPINITDGLSSEEHVRRLRNG